MRFERCRAWRQLLWDVWEGFLSIGVPVARSITPVTVTVCATRSCARGSRAARRMADMTSSISASHVPGDMGVATA